MPAPYHIAGTQQVPARNKIGNLSQYSWNPQAPSFTMGQVRNQTPLTNAQYFPLQTRLPLAQWDVTSFNSIGNLRIIGGNSINSGIASTSGGIGNSGIGGYIPYGTAVNGQTINEKAAVLNEARFREATIAKGLSTATGVFAIDAGRGQQGAVAERVQNKKFDSKSFKTTAKKPKKKKNKAPAGAVAEQASQTINAPGPAPSSTSDTGTSTTEVDYSVGLVVQTPSNKVSIPQPTPTTVIHAFESTPFASVDTALHEAPSTIKPKKKGRLPRKMVQSIVEPGMSRRERIWAERGAEAQAAAQAAAQKADELPKCAAVSSESATSALVRVPQNKENLDVFLNTPPPMPGRSLQLASLAPIKPTLATVLDMSNIPFAETARTHPSSCTTGLIKICNVSDPSYYWDIILTSTDSMDGHF